MEENNVMQQQETTNLMQVMDTITDMVPEGSDVIINLPSQPNNGPTTVTPNYVPSTGNKAAAFAAGAGVAGLAVGAVIGVRFLIKKHKAKKAAAQAETIVSQEESIDE